MKLLPYEPMTGTQVLEMRAILPALVAWLRAREAISHSPFRIPHSGRRPAK